MIFNNIKWDNESIGIISYHWKIESQSSHHFKIVFFRNHEDQSHFDTSHRFHIHWGKQLYRFCMHRVENLNIDFYFFYIRAFYYRHVEEVEGIGEDAEEGDSVEEGKISIDFRDNLLTVPNMDTYNISLMINTFYHPIDHNVSSSYEVITHFICPLTSFYTRFSLYFPIT